MHLRVNTDMHIYVIKPAGLQSNAPQTNAPRFQLETSSRIVADPAIVPRLSTKWALCRFWITAASCGLCLSWLHRAAET